MIRRAPVGLPGGWIVDFKSCGNFHDRIRVDETGTVRVLNPYSSDRLPTTILTVAPSGCDLRVPEAMPPGANIQLLLDGAILMGEITRCVKAEDGFIVHMHVYECFCSR